MRKGKDVQWTHVDFANYSLKDYYADISMIRLVSHYVRLTRGEKDFENQQYFGEFEKNGQRHSVFVDIEFNFCNVDGNPINPEEFVILFEGDEKNPTDKIKEITGIDEDDYLTDVTYSDGTVEIFEVKGKCLLPFGFPKNS